jgi:hypothetical protein
MKGFYRHLHVGSSYLWFRGAVAKMREVNWRWKTNLWLAPVHKGFLKPLDRETTSMWITAQIMVELGLSLNVLCLKPA